MANRSRVFLIHGWNATPRNAWYPWLKDQLENNGIEVHVPQLPNARWPFIHRWTDALMQEVGVCDEQTYFIGHSLGVQAILRYLAKLPRDQYAGGAVFVGGFDRLHVWWPYLIGAYICLGRWLYSPIDWKNVRAHAKKFSAFFSDNDGWVSDESDGCFRTFLSADIRVLHGYGHFTGDEGIYRVPEVLEEVLAMIAHKHARERTPEKKSEPMFDLLPLHTRST